MAPTAPASRAGISPRRRSSRASCGLVAERGRRFRARARTRAGERARRCSSPARFTPSATRCRCCRCRRSPGNFSGWPRAPSPDFAISIPSSSPSARTSWACGATWRAGTRSSEYDGPPLEPLELYTKKSGDEIVGQLYNFADKGGREVALRPEMTPTLARMAAREGERAAQADSLVLDAAALSLRAPAARPAARALSAQRRHHRRGRRHRRRGAARRRDRDHARLRARRRATCARACPTVGCCARCSPRSA